MNFGQIKNHVRKNIGRSIGQTERDADILDWVNFAIRKLALRYNFDWTKKDTAIATSNGVKTYSLPSDFKELELIRFDDATEIISPLQEVDLANKFTKSDTGKPQFFRPIPAGNVQQLEFWPTPDQTYNLTATYFSFPADLALDSDQNLFTILAPDLVIAGATMEALRSLGQHDQAAIWAQVYESEAARAFLKDVQTATSERPTMQNLNI